MKRFFKLIACLLIIACGFSVVACSIQKDTNISSIEIVEESIPETILIGKFDEAEIKAKINYADGSKETIKITTEMLPVKYRALVNIPGNYEITIVLKGKETKLNITIINPDQFLVNFYNANGLLINTQFVEAGKDAILPDKELAEVEGLEFIGWDRLTTNITEDTNIYGIYASVDSTFINIEKMFNSLYKAEENLKTTSHYTSLISYNFGDTSDIERGYILYSYNKEDETATSFGEINSNLYQEKFSYDEKFFDLFIKYTNQEEYIKSESYKKMAEDYASILDYYGGFDGYISQSKLYGGYTFFPIKYMVENYKMTLNWKDAENRSIYTANFTDDNEFEKSVYSITFDNDRIYSFKHSVYDSYTNELCSTTEFYHDYQVPEIQIENPFKMTGDATLDGELDIRDAATILQYTAGKIELSKLAISNSDVNQDGIITDLDAKLILYVLTNRITIEDAKNFLAGDVNRDNKITIDDLIIINNHIASNFLTGTELMLADVNTDGIIDIKDLDILAKVLDEQNKI